MLFTFLWNCICFIIFFLIVNALRQILEYIVDKIISVPLNKNPTYHLSVLTDLVGWAIWIALWIVEIIVLLFAFIRIFKI